MFIKFITTYLFVILIGGVICGTIIFLLMEKPLKQIVLPSFFLSTGIVIYTCLLTLVDMKAYIPLALNLGLICVGSALLAFICYTAKGFRLFVHTFLMNFVLMMMLEMYMCI